MLFTPTGRLVTTRVDTPLALTMALPMVVPLLEKIIVPAGVPETLELNVATRVTDCSKLEGFGDEVRDALVFPCTTWSITGDVLGSKVVSPLYAAVMT